MFVSKGEGNSVQDCELERAEMALVRSVGDGRCLESRHPNTGEVSAVSDCQHEHILVTFLA